MSPIKKKNFKKNIINKIKKNKNNKKLKKNSQKNA